MKVIIIILCCLMLVGCIGESNRYVKPWIIISKKPDPENSTWDCIYQYQTDNMNFGTFIDTYNKYNVGDTIK